MSYNKTREARKSKVIWWSQTSLYPYQIPHFLFFITLLLYCFCCQEELSHLFVTDFSWDFPHWFPQNCLSSWEILSWDLPLLRLIQLQNPSEFSKWIFLAQVASHHRVIYPYALMFICVDHHAGSSGLTSVPMENYCLSWSPGETGITL